MIPLTLDALVAQWAARTPENVAVRFGNQSYTYAELLSKSNFIAAHLASLDIGPGDRVGVYTPKSLDSVAALVGIMRAGAAYVPVDPGAPFERARYVFSHCGVKAILCGGRPWRANKAQDFGATVLVLDPDPGDPTFAEAPEPPPPRHTASHLAYVLYTSGSTGQPKGVAITHAQSLAFVWPAAQVFALRATDTLVSHAPFNFDLSVIDLWCAFAVGAATYLVPESWLGFPAKMAEAMASVTVWNSVPSALIQLTEHGKLANRDLSALRLVMFAGEPYPPKQLRVLQQLLPHTRLLNVYGQTEANSSTFFEVLPISDQDAPIPIGKCFPNYAVLLLDAAQKPITDPNVEGELYVVGDAVASGYWNDPERTALAFVPHPLQPQRRWTVYKTGDRMSFDANGDLIFRGRVDFAIKCRGFRVEPGEIEAIAQSYPGIQEACVIPVPHETHGNLLVLFVSGAAAESDLRRHLGERLPRYMLPEVIQYLPNLPRGGTGKVDRAQLRPQATMLLKPH